MKSSVLLGQIASGSTVEASHLNGPTSKLDCIDSAVYGGSRMSYLGSKAASGAYQAIIAQMPPHDLYIETHLGTGAVMRHKPAAARSIGIERDAELLKDFQCDYDVELVEQDCIEWLKSFNFYLGCRVLVYADPPYLLSTG